MPVTMNIATVVLVTAATALAGCSSAGSEVASPEAGSGDVVRMWIEPELVECVGVAPMECMQVAYSEDGESQLFYDSIAGFDHQEGTSYVIDVQVTEVEDPPADASSLSYTLVDVISETPQ